MHCGIGVSHIQSDLNEKFIKVGEGLNVSQIAQLQDELSKLEDDLVSYARNNESLLAKNTKLFKTIFALARELGIELFPLKKRFQDSHGLSHRFYDELGSRIIEVCLELRWITGDAIPVRIICQNLHRKMRVREGDSMCITPTDVRRALKRMSILGETEYIYVSPVPGSGDEPLVLCSEEYSSDVIAVIQVAVRHSEPLEKVLGHVDLPEFKLTLLDTSKSNECESNISRIPLPSEFSALCRDVITNLDMENCNDYGDIAETSSDIDRNANPTEVFEDGRLPPRVRIPNVARLSINNLAGELHWTEQRAFAALQASLSASETWIDKVDGSYWFLGL